MLTPMVQRVQVTYRLARVAKFPELIVTGP